MSQSLSLEIDCRSVKAKLDAGEDFAFVDCREADEHALVRIEAATLIPMSQFAQRASELDALRGKPIVIHCHHGGRSMRVVQWLRQQGFAQAQSMAGGIDQWAMEIEPGMARY
jgi:rhodanese-related sulfurtransferase